MAWLALTLQLDPQAAEAMSDALLAAGAQSVALDDLDTPNPSLRVLLDADADASACVATAARSIGLARAPHFATSVISDEDWVRRTQSQFAPLEIGERLWIGPSWHEPPTGRIAVRIDPGLAFGTGGHPSTRLGLQFLERRLRGGERVLDYGCGSGVLAIVAAKLGATRVDAVDLDLQAVQTTLANADINRVTLRAGLPEHLAPATYDVVVANILAQPLIVLAPLLASRTAAGGSLALSGILESQASEVSAAYAPWIKLRLAERDDAWVLLAGVRE